MQPAFLAESLSSSSTSIRPAIPNSTSCSYCCHPAKHCLPRLQVAQHSQTMKGSLHKTRRKSTGITKAAAAVESTPIGVGEIADVEDLEGIRVLVGEDNRPVIQYLIKWKDGAPNTWEPIENLSDNLLRDFEDQWWKCCREGDEETMRRMLDHSKDVLPHCVDTNERSALHFAAALGKAECCAMLCKAGAEVDYSDKDGYTPLHMAVGYSHVSTVKTLLDAGANPEIPDNQGRNVVQLVDSIREQMPLNPQLAGKRIALEEVASLLTGNLFEEVFPRRILEARTISDSGAKEYLIQWHDGSEDSWVKESDVANDVIQDYEHGYEYAEAESLLKRKSRGDQRLYLVKWLDGSPESWEFEDHISPVLVQAYEQKRRGEREFAADQASSQLPRLPENSTLISKRAARRARKAARRAAAESGTASENGSSQQEITAKQDEDSVDQNGDGHHHHHDNLDGAIIEHSRGAERVQDKHAEEKQTVNV